MKAIVLPAVLLIVVLSAGCGSSRRGPVEGSGPATRNSGAIVTSISCPAAGECAAGGFYNSSNAGYQPLVVSQSNGSWGTAIEVPGMGTLTRLGGARVSSISCAAPGECAAGGYYYDHRGQHAFVVSAANGKWGNAIEVPGTAKLDGVGVASVLSISCAAPGECAAGGNYSNSFGESFVVSETNGRWGTAIDVRGVARLGSWTTLTSISCAAPGECAAGGYDTGDAPDYRSQAFVVSETNGSWGRATEVPGVATLNAGNSAGVTSISCAATGECAAGGFDLGDRGDAEEAFVVNETNGNWGSAIKVAGTATHGVRTVHVNSISCGAPGECAAGGYYADGSSGDREKPFVVSETNGSWGSAVEVPGTESLKASCAPRPSTRRCSFPGGAEVTSISCAAAGACAAGGAVLNHSPFRRNYPVNYPTFVVNETKGSWGTAIAVPGTSNLLSISCAAAGECAAGGGYFQAYVVNEKNGNWGNALRFK